MGKERIAQQQTSAWLLLRNHCIILCFVRHQMTWRMHDKYREMPPAAGQVSSAESGRQGGARGSVTLWQRALLPGLTRGAVSVPPPRGLLPGVPVWEGEDMTANQRSWLGGQREGAGKSGGLPGGPVLKTQHFKCCVWVQFLVREPRDYKLYGMAKKKIKCFKAHSLPPDL